MVRRGHSPDDIVGCIDHSPRRSFETRVEEPPTDIECRAPEVHPSRRTDGFLHSKPPPELRGGGNTEASASRAQSGQPGPGQNHAGVPGSPASTGPTRENPSQGCRHPPLPGAPSLNDSRGPMCQVLVIEDLNVAGMVRNGHLARSLSDAAMGEFSRQLLYRARWHGWKCEELIGSSRVPRPVGAVASSEMTSTRRHRPTRVGPAAWSSTVTSTRPST